MEPDDPPPPPHREQLTLELDGTITLDIHRPGLHIRAVNINAGPLAAALAEVLKAQGELKPF